MKPTAVSVGKSRDIFQYQILLSYFRIIFDYFGSGETGDPRTGIQLLGIVVANGMPPYDPVTSGPVDEQK